MNLFASFKLPKGGRKRKHKNMRMLQLWKFAACIGVGVIFARVGENLCSPVQPVRHELVPSGNETDERQASLYTHGVVEKPVKPVVPGWIKATKGIALVSAYGSGAWGILLTVYAWVAFQKATNSEEPAHLLVMLFLPFIVGALWFEMQRTEPGHAWIGRAMKPLAYIAGMAAIFAFNLSQLVGDDLEMSTAFGELGIGLFIAAAAYPVLFVCRACLDHYERLSQR